MTINEIIARGRIMLKDYSKDTRFNDETIWSLYSDSFAKIVTNKLKKFNYISPSLYKTVCIEMEKKKGHECGCVSLGCDVYKSVYPIPNYLSGRNNSTLILFPISNNIKTAKEIDWEEYSFLQEDDIYSKSILYAIVNNHLVVFNSQSKHFQLRAIWSDITKLEDIKSCPQGVSCPDYLNIDTGHDSDLVEDTFSLLINKLKLPLTISEDLTNDSNPEIKS